MNIIINSQNRDVADRASLAEVVAQFAKRPEVVIAELNGKIIDRQRWPEIVLSAGDRIELVAFVGGG